MLHFRCKQFLCFFRLLLGCSPTLLHVMKSIRIVLAVFAVLMTINAKGQDLNIHRWQDRLLVIMAPDTKDPFYLEQMEVLQKDTAGLSERRLVIYTATPGGYWKGLETGTLEGSENLYQEYKRLRTSFEVLLIGLDGGVKLREGTPLTLEKLYSTIDAMPMRKQEIRRQNK